jgi:ribonuclease P protein component
VSLEFWRGQPGCAEILGRNATSSVAKFPKSVRLLKHADFRRVYEHGKRQFSGNLTVFFLTRMPEQDAKIEGARVGITVSRALGGAVQRNRIKRRMREAVRANMELLQQDAVDVVINPKKTAMTVEFATLSDELSRAFEVVGRRLEEAKAGSPR